MAKNPTTFEEFKEGTWKNESIGDFAKQKDFENYQREFGKATESGKKRIAEAHGFEYKPKKDKKKKKKEIKYKPPKKKVTESPDERPEYEGPEYYDPRTFDPTPEYMELREIADDEFVSNRIASFFEHGSPLFRQFSEAAARKFGNRGPRAQEAMMGEIMKVARPIAEAEALMLERDRTLHNTAYYKQMDIRMQGAIQQALSHIAGGYQIQATIINDITNQWKAQLASDTQVYGIDVGAATSVYATKVQEALGMAGLDVKMADILSKIEDNAEAASFIWDMIYGDNDLSPAEFHEKWKEKWADLAGDTETGTTDTGGVDQWKTHIEAFYTKSKHQHFKNLAMAHGVLPWFISKYGENP